MASGPLPKRVTCPTCGAPEGVPCRDPKTMQPSRPHAARQDEAERWYDRPSPDGLTPRRRDSMVEQLQDVLGRRGDVGKAMQKITTSADPEAEFKRLVD